MTKAAFTPHAIIVCERSVPTSPTFAAILGIDNLLKLSLDPSRGEHTYLQQALDGLQNRLARYETDSFKGKIPYFDRPIGVTVHYRPDHIVRHDLDGNISEGNGPFSRIGRGHLSLA
ncbi:hypothetical protein [Methylobacterium sp. J-092]|uniref:hypothetical protein n=1 Tax=Methylobacterium sp. J-092 TaxID=2836667 RepID=UPI001FB99B83|nr:hypothetical protein [Methylobacterium sp. J-092]MCJ2010425.1 hypothetical protein [Methylobacterium sp. J-092]